jgi:hypothetical protein
MPSITFITNIYDGASLFFKCIVTFIRYLAYGIPELPMSGPWSVEELQLLQEVANYWATGTVDSGNGNQKVIDWTSAVEDMNKDSRTFFISNREYTFEECYDKLLIHWINPSRENRLTRVNWTVEEIELIREASITCPRRECLEYERRLVMDFERVQIFMNREALRRGIRRRYYSIAALQNAYLKHCLSSSSTQEQAPDDLLNLQDAGFADPQFANLRVEIYNPLDENITNDEAVAQEVDQLQLHIGYSQTQVDQEILEQTINLLLRRDGGGTPTFIDQFFAWTRPS